MYFEAGIEQDVDNQRPSRCWLSIQSTAVDQFSVVVVPNALLIKFTSEGIGNKHWPDEEWENILITFLVKGRTRRHQPELTSISVKSVCPCRYQVSLRQQ